MTTTALLKLILAGFGALLVAIGLGRFGYPPLIPAMIEAGWLSADGARLGAATNLAGYGIGAVLAAPLMRMAGTQPSLLMGLIGGVAAFAFSTVPLSPWLFALMRGLSGLAGGVLMILMPPLIASVVPPNWRGRANGFVFTGLGAGFLLSGTLVPALATIGVGVAWGGLTVIVFIGALMAWLFRPQQDLALGTMADASYRKSDLRLVGLMLAYGGAAMGYVPHTTIFVDYVARELKMGLGVGGFMWVMAGVTAFLGPLIGGFVSERLGFKIALRIVVAAMAVGAFLPVVSHHPAVLTLSVMLAGGLMIACASFAAGRTREIVGGEAHAPAWGLVTVAFSVLQAVGAYGFSWLLKADGSYSLAFTLAGAIIAAGVAADIILCALDDKKADDVAITR